MFEIHGALLNPRSRNLAWHVNDLLQSSFRNPFLRNHLGRLSNLLHYGQWHCGAPVGPTRSSGPHVSLAPVVASELSAASTVSSVCWTCGNSPVFCSFLHHSHPRSCQCDGPVRPQRCSALSGPWRHDLAPQRASQPLCLRVTRRHELHLWYLNGLRDLLNRRHLSLCHPRIARSSCR